MKLLKLLAILKIKGINKLIKKIKKKIFHLLEKLYSIPNKSLRKKIENLFIRFDGGMFFSESLRNVYKKYHGIQVGIGSYGCFDQSKFPKGTKIGRYCSIAPNVKYLNGNHPKNFVSTHPIFYRKEFEYIKDEKIVRSRLEIGDDVWIGYGTIILPSVNKIETGAIIGAGSVVTKNIKEYSIVVGNPAKKIGERFSKEQQKIIKKTRWFEKNPEELKKYAEDFANKDIFIKKFQ